MKIAVVIRQVPDTEARLKVDGGKVDLSGVKLILNPYDEYAVEEAVRIAQPGGVETCAFTLGPAQADDAVRTTLAMGLDRAVRIDDDGALYHADAFARGRALAVALEEWGPDLVLLGRQEIDQDTQNLGPVIAEELGRPSAAWASKLVLEEGKAVVTRDVDGGTETLELPLPAIVTTNKGLNEPRYPSLPNIMKAKKKEIRVVKPADLGAPVKARVTRVSAAAPSSARRGVKLTGDPADAARELARLLREDAKAL